MHLLPFLFAILTVFFFFFFSRLSASPPNSTVHVIGSWCNTTPHRDACSYCLTHSARPSVSYPIDRAEFYKLSVQAALNRTILAQSHLQALRQKCRTPGEENAWIDCVKLYGTTVLQLNRTLHPTDGYTPHDEQTWLSAAMTNLQMCRKGFTLLDPPVDLLSPLSIYNVSDLISNCLAINQPAVQSSGSTQGGELPLGLTSTGYRRLLQASKAAANLVVAQDGSGNFRTVGEAINAASRMTRNGRLVIYVKAGVYNENVQIGNTVEDITLLGDGKGKTVLGSSLGTGGATTLITSSSLVVYGDGFIARDMTFRNTFGTASTAVALLVASDRSAIYRCSIEGYQDTLFAFSQRQFYRECDIYGTIDFIFGNAAAVFQNCSIYFRRPKPGQSNVITAQARSDPNQNTGFVIQFSSIKSSAEFWPVHRTVRSYLGRPWMLYSRTVYLQNYMDSSIDPAGWLPWNGGFALNTLYYAEFRNTGQGSLMSRRVTWPGYHIVVKPSLVSQFTVANFIAGGMWLPSTGMPFVSGL